MAFCNACGAARNGRFCTECGASADVSAAVPIATRVRPRLGGAAGATGSNGATGAGYAAGFAPGAEPSGGVARSGSSAFEQAWPALMRGYDRYARFSGRASRGEYLWFHLLNSVVGFGLHAVVGAVAPALSTLVTLTAIMPGVAMSVRRLHDVDRDARTMLWALVPIVGGLYVLFLMLSPSKAGSNRFGPPDPLLPARARA